MKKATAAIVRTSALLALLCPLLAGPPLLAAQMDYEKELSSVRSRVIETEANVSEVHDDIVERRGFIGSSEAEARFENAVYYYLVGEYDRAAKEFFTLVESNSLRDANAASDAEWYLAESLFEMSNYVLAEEAYYEMIEQGTRHAFFASAVRRLMELYSITGNTDGFYTLYNQYIVPGRVEPTDVVRYSVAKSFYRQSEYDKARELLVQISEDGGEYGRARYLMGVIYVVEGNYNSAVEEFKRSADISISSPEEQEIADLSSLALGRLYQELDDYVNSALYYQRISRESEFFADALYEVGWTFIRDGDYAQALQSVEIFLLAFPEHRHAPQLRLLQGKLHMKEIQYESALSSFEEVISAYTPLQGSLKEMAASSDTASRWLDDLIELDVSPTEFDDSTGISTYEQNADKLPVPGGEPLPAFAVEMLVTQDDMSRAFALSRELSYQRTEIEESQELIEELEIALQASGDALGVFQKARLQLDRYEGESFLMLGELLRIEEAWLLNHAEGATQSELQGLQAQREELAGQLTRLRTTELDRGERVKRYDAQVREVQQRAATLTNQIDAFKTEAAELERLMDKGDHELGEFDEQQVRDQLSQVEAEIAVAEEELQRVQSERTRLEVTDPIRRRPDPDQRDSEIEQLQAELGALKRRFDGYWGRVEGTDRDTVRGSIDDLWGRVDTAQGRIMEVRSGMESGERTELASVRSRLATETGTVSEARRELLSYEVSADHISGEVARLGFQQLSDEFAETLLQADVGIVDVYWLRKVTVTDDREGVQKDREELLRDLNERFRIIRQGLEE